jgi:hypothetical protein
MKSRASCKLTRLSQNGNGLLVPRSKYSGAKLDEVVDLRSAVFRISIVPRRSLIAIRQDPWSSD